MASVAPARVSWNGWDGATLRWQVDAVDAAAVELHLDGVAFARRTGHGAQSLSLPCSPSGNAELEFSLLADGVPLAAPWRVRFGEAASAGVDCWNGPPRALAMLAEAPRLPLPAGSGQPPVAVVVAIYNAPESVRRCLEALDRWTAADVRQILVDDGSSDAAIAPLLEAWSRRPNVTVVRHARNRGYTSAVNSGIAAAAGADVVLLNSDTQVGPHWLPALRRAAWSDATIGTATAVSDNAGAFSVPELEQFCPIPAPWSLVQTQRALLQQAGQRYPELPTGNGFCLYIKRELIERIGSMDADAFPAGYGEENDFCQRAVRAGWRNVIAGDVFVQHERSASFGDARRAELGARGMAVLRERYPAYESDVGATLFGVDRLILDYRVRRIYAAAAGAPAPRERVLTLAAGPETSLPSAGGDAVERYCIGDDTVPSLLRVDAGALVEVATAPGSTLAQAVAHWLVALGFESVELVGPVSEQAARIAEVASALGIGPRPFAG